LKSKAVCFVAPEKVEIREIDVPLPERDEVMVRIKACGVCQGDVSTFLSIKDVPHIFPSFQGHEGVGVVEKVGPQVKNIAPSDTVATLWGGGGGGHFSQYITLPEDYVAKISIQVEKFEHWIVEPVADIVNAIDFTGIFPGNRIAVIGCGFMGLLWIQGLKRTLAKEIIAIEVDPQRLRLAQKFGADIVFNPKQEQIKLKELYEGKVDTVVEVAGVQEALDLATNLVRVGGTLTIFAWHHDPRLIRTPGKWHLKGLKVLNATPFMSPNFAEVFQRTVPLLEKKIFDLKPLVTHTLPYTDAQKMLEIASKKEERYIKGVLLF